MLRLSGLWYTNNTCVKAVVFRVAGAVFRANQTHSHRRYHLLSDPRPGTFKNAPPGTGAEIEGFLKEFALET